MKKNLFAVVLLSSSLFAHKEVVREIAQDIRRSNCEGAKAHLTRLHRFNLSQKEHKTLLKSLKADAEMVRKNQEDTIRIGTSWVDSLTTIGGSLITLYGLKALRGGSRKRAPQVRRYLDEDDFSTGRGSGGRGLSPLGKVVSFAMIPTGIYTAYNGYKCWYQKRCIGAAQKVEECIEDALDEVRKG